VATPAETLNQVDLFGGLSQRQLKRLAARFTERRFTAGATIVRQGAMSGVGFFVVTDGEASVTVDGREVERIGPGGHFGELALVAERERAATVTAESALTCLEIPIWDFRDFVKGDPDVAWKLLEHVVRTFLDAPAK
jgi:CRP-like cAMP-binding protein